MRRIVKRRLGRSLPPRPAPQLNQPSPQASDEVQAVNKEIQVLLSLRYKELMACRAPLPKFEDIGFRVFSQNDEDGILLYIFSLIGTANKRAVEVCAGDGIECNAANLIINHGWTGLLFDGNEALIKQGRSFYAQCKDTWLFPPELVHAWIDVENINALMEGHGFVGEVDLLSLDTDGMEYWIWKAIECISPRVVVVEYQDILGPDKAVTVPYKKDFDRFDIHPDYYGASLGAFVKLAREKGYRLIGSNRYGFNAFFVRSGICEDVLPEVEPAACFVHPKVAQGRRMRFPDVASYEWVEV